MKKQDILFILIFTVIVLPFIPFSLFETFQSNFLYNEKYWLITSFLKFALLATLGEVIGLRIQKGIYYEKNFGLLSRMFVWGVLGITIKIAFVLYAAGVPFLLEKYFFVNNAIEAMNLKDIFEASNMNLGFVRFLDAFTISTIMNLTYAPVMMTFHKITDTHILNTNGKFLKFFSPIKFKTIIPSLNWNILWNFIFKKTIPLFWIPMQTINFLLPSEFRVVVAAFLGIMLGILLSIAAIKSKKV
ncbi:MAG: Mpv17/PMP22 family protein [Bacteroidales bacterium]|nr:Mpv17/PMP22 family protein [Bacteroidales bacterium]